MQPSQGSGSSGQGNTLGSDLEKNLSDHGRDGSKLKLMVQHWLVESFHDGPFNNISAARQITIETGGIMNYGSSACDKKHPNST